jgi:multiple sugar transport system substrate-binding protein
MADYYDELITQFNEQSPHITVVRKTAGSDETWRYLFREKQVDTFVFSSDEELYRELLQDDKVLNLGPFIQEDDTFDLEDFYPSLLEPNRIEGKVWALPAGVNLGVVYYNKDLLDQYNVAYPEADWTWDDLLMTALSVRDESEEIYGLASLPVFAIPFVYQHGGRIVDDWRTPTQLTLDDPLTVEAIEWYAGLIHDYDVMPSPQEATRRFGSDGSPGYVFWRCNAGLYLGFFSDRGGETWGPQAKWQMNWGIAPLPRDERASTLGLVLAYAASSDTRHPEACWEWLTYLSEQIPPYVMPARRSLAESDDYSRQVGEEAAAVARAAIQDALIVSNVQIAGLGEDTEDFGEALTEIMNGSVPALEALTDLQRQVDSSQ